MSFQIRKRMASCCCKRNKSLTLRGFPRTITHDPAQICRRCVMFSALILIIQAVWRNEMRIKAAKFFCFFIHTGRKGFHGTIHMFRNCIGAVIKRLEHQAVKKVSQIKLFPLFHPKMHLGLSRSIGTYCDNFIRCTFFKCKDTGHDLGRTGIRKRKCFLFSVQNPVTFSVCHCTGF